MAIATLGNITEKQKESQQAIINYEVQAKDDLICPTSKKLKID